MAFSSRVIYADTVNYCNAGNQSTTGYYAVAKRVASTAYVVGDIVRQESAARNAERCFVCTVPGTTGASVPAWVVTRGAKTADGTVTWQECTGGAAVNGDSISTPTWEFAVGYLTGRKIAIGQIVKYTNDDDETSYQICSVAGVAGAVEPAFGDTAGLPAVDGTVTWISLGPVGDYDIGGAPHARIANAGTEHWFYGGGTIYVGDNHAESQTGANITFATMFQSTDPLSMSMMLCHDHAGHYPPDELDLRSSAIVATSDSRIYFYPGGSFYTYGVTFKANGLITLRPMGSIDSFFSTKVNKQNWALFDRCSFWLQTGNLYIGESYVFGARVFANIVFNDTTVHLGADSVYLAPFFTRFIWRNTERSVLEPGSAIPRLLISTPGINDNLYDATFEACNFGQLASKLYFTDFFQQASMVLKDCKLHPMATFDQVPENVGMVVQTVRCAPDPVPYQSEVFVYEGRDSTEPVITRVGGAEDPTLQAQSRRLCTTSGATWLRPLQASPYAIWNSTVGAPVTLTVCGLASDALPLNEDIWLEVEYLADPASTLGAIVTTTKATFLSSPVAVPADNSGWYNTSFAVFDGNTLSNAALSNGSRTAMFDRQGFGSGSGGARSVSYRSAGKYYFEVAVDTAPHGTVGALLSTGGYSDFSKALAVELASGNIFSNNSFFRSLGAFIKGDVVGIAVDLAGRRAWARRNGGLWNANAGANPDAGSGGAVLAVGEYAPAVRFVSSLDGETLTLNRPFDFVPPAEFASWPGAVWKSFKLVVTVTPAHAGYIHVRPMVGKPSTTYFLDPLVVAS